MRNLKFTIEYNGAKFFGWQKQNGKRTVQGELERCFYELTKERVSFEGSGRTDKGVHALGQVASVVCENKIPLKNIKTALNNLLPSDVRIVKVENAEESFHARFSSKRKTYLYIVQVGGSRSALECDTIGFFPYDVDLQKMKEAGEMLVGKHNFKAFCSADTSVKNFEREIYSFNISKRGRKIKFEICGNGFLYNMVRIIVGTLLDIGRGKLDKNCIRDAFLTEKRSILGKTMEPNGLYLKKVEY